MSYPKKTVLGVLAAGLVAASLAGCDTNTGDAQPTAQPPTPAPSSPTVAAGRPTATATATATVTATKPPAGGEGGSAGWATTDFAKVMFGRLGCPDFAEAHGRATVLTVVRADLTGDGRTEAVVAGACASTTASNPAQVVVFDGAGPADPSPLVTIGQGQDLVTAKVRAEGRTVTVTSEALSAKAPRCCPDRLITQAWSWQGGRFVRVRLDITE